MDLDKILYINESAVKALLNWDDLYEAIETALKSPSQNPPRTTTKISTNAVLFTMPGLLDHPKFGGAACKLVTCRPDNVHRQLPAIQANITLFDQSTGELKALIAANEITVWRTACASAVATQHLTKGKQLKVLAVLGAGLQGRAHAISFQHFFRFDEVRIWNRTGTKAEILVADLNGTFEGNLFKSVNSRRDCVTDADVVVTATSTSETLVELDWLKIGTHVNAVGGGNTHYGELSTAIYQSSYVYVDQHSSALVEAGDLLKFGVTFRGEIGQVISGQLSLPPPNEITVFLSLGLAVEDCAAARLIYDLYKKTMEKTTSIN